VTFFALEMKGVVGRILRQRSSTPTSSRRIPNGNKNGAAAVSKNTADSDAQTSRSPTS
jgi:hypothetical protein